MSIIRLLEKYYYAPFDATHYFSSDVGFTNILVRSTGQSGTEINSYNTHTVQNKQLFVNIFLIDKTKISSFSPVGHSITHAQLVHHVTFKVAFIPALNSFVIAQTMIYHSRTKTCHNISYIYHVRMYHKPLHVLYPFHVVQYAVLYTCISIVTEKLNPSK